MKANFNIKKNNEIKKDVQNNDDPKKDFTESEFEEFMSKTGASGSFMIFRSTKKENELGLEEL
ncbi:MAG TPA: hypothetical protein VEU72_03035 [Nitrosopumilaceae archaeon]|nr:hypothetical protein [Nitrosopumilaceae archaeon]